MTEIPTIYQDDLAALARHALTTLAGILITHALLTAGQSAAFVQLGLGVLTFVATIAWSWYQKHYAKQLLQVALAAQPLTTELQVISQVAAGVGIPSVLTKPTAVPIPVTP